MGLLGEDGGERCTPYVYALCLGSGERKEAAAPRGGPECELAAGARAVVRCSVLGRWPVLLEAWSLSSRPICSSP